MIFSVYKLFFQGNGNDQMSALHNYFKAEYIIVRKLLKTVRKLDFTF